MMTPAEHPAREDVMAYLDGELSADHEADVRAHLETCDACRSFADELTTISRHLAAWRVDPVPATMNERLEEVIHAGTRSRTRNTARWRQLLRWEIPRWQLAGAVALVVIAVVVSLPQLRRAPAGPVAVNKEPARPAEESAAQKAVEESGVARILGSTGEPALPGVNIGLVIARTATVHITVADINQARADLEKYLGSHHGYIVQLETSGEPPAVRMLVTTVKVQADQLDATLTMLRGLGRVRDESQGSEDVTLQSVDLDARLTNTRRTEQRLVAMLQSRGEKVSDVLAVEREVSRVRGEIEQMEAQRRQLTTRIDLATIELQIEEERRAGFTVSDPSTGAELRNAAVDGFRAAVTSTIGLLLLLLRIGPTLVLWAAALAWPVKVLWQRRARPRALARRS